MSTKRRKAPNGEGGLQWHADGKRVRANISVRLPDGTRKRVVGTYRITRRAAEQDRRALIAARDAGYLATKRLTVEQFGEQWLADVAHPTVRQTTYYAYCIHLRHTIFPALGRKRLDALTAGEVQALWSRMLRDGMEIASVHTVRAVLIAMLSTAKRWRLVTENVGKDTTLAPIPRKPRPTLTPEQVQRLRLAALGTPADLAVHLGLLGLRSGEMCALTWDAIDEDARTLTISSTRVYAPGGLVNGPTKTPMSTRVLILPDPVIDALHAHALRQADQREIAGDCWVETGAVFTSRTGRPMSVSVIRASFYAALTEAGLPRMRLHDLRYMAVSFMAAAGVPLKTQMATLGHVRVQQTMDYTHVGDDDREAAAAALGRVLGG